MDCPLCQRAMEPVADENATYGWVCPEHGEFKVLCTCGYIKGQDHDILCPKRKSAD